MVTLEGGGGQNSPIKNQADIFPRIESECFLFTAVFKMPVFHSFILVTVFKQQIVVLGFIHLPCSSNKQILKIKIYIFGSFSNINFIRM